MSSVMLGAFLGTEPSVQSAAASCAFVGIAGELASEKTDACGGGTMTFRNLFIDQVSLMTQEKMSRCRVHILSLIHIYNDVLRCLFRRSFLCFHFF